jgi:pyridoxal phosphate enzyme (YggS family)
MNHERLRSNLVAVRQRMAGAARRSGREPDAVRLVAVTKQAPVAWAAALVELGQRDLGENYPQELWRKAEALAALPVSWHLIGHLQGNKAKKTVPLVGWIHSVDSLKLLRTLDELSGSLAVPPRVCLQVNTSGEPTKHGWTAEQLLAEGERIAALRHIRIAGLMTMAAQGTDAETARPSFARLRRIRDELRCRTGLRLDDLSMGMSNDFEAAIEEGATLVRIGSALFEGVQP